MKKPYPEDTKDTAYLIIVKDNKDKVAERRRRNKNAQDIRRANIASRML